MFIVNTNHHISTSHRWAQWVCFLVLLPFHAEAQQEDLAVMDSIAKGDAKALLGDSLNVVEDSTSLVVKKKPRKMKEKRDWSTWKPNPQRALWLALVLPGAGQIYNRKFWKLPIIYGGFLGCIYALTWNNMMYKDYTITPENEERYKEIFRSRKDKYRRWRDMSFFVMLGVYAISVIDAYVDAELSVFDISNDLSLTIEPAVIPNHGGGSLLDRQSLGVSCKLNF